MKHIASIILFLAIGSIIMLSSCHAPEKKQVSTAEKEPTKPEIKDNDIDLTDGQIQGVGIKIGSIMQKNLHSVVKANGRLTVPPQGSANVSVLIGGVITSVTVLEGKAVTKGQVVATIENPEFVKMQQDYLTTRNDFTFIEAEYQRQKELQEQHAGTGKVFQQAEANYNAQRAKLQSLEKQLQQINVNIPGLQKGNIITTVPVLAPISGIVGHINVNIGTFIDPAKSLMDIVDNSRIYCALFVFERDVFKVKPGQKVNLTLNNQQNTQLTGEIYGINRSFESDSKTVAAHATIRNAGNYSLIPGLYVTALIDLGNQLTNAVPAEAVVRSEDKDYIFIQVNKHHGIEKDSTGEEKEKIVSFRRVEVVTGVTELGYTEITPLEEIPTGTGVVLKGAFYILSKEKSGNTKDLD